MKHLLLVFALLATCWSLDEQAEWQNFQKTHGKSYNPLEQLQRFQIFSKNLERIKEHNKKFDQGLTSYKMGVTQFADLTPEEFIKQLKTPIFPNNLAKKITTNSIKKDIKEMDWRDKNIVTPVKNQGQCGSSILISSLENVESQFALLTKDLVVLSVDCLAKCMQMDCSTIDIKYAFGGMFLFGVYKEGDECKCTPEDATVNVPALIQCINQTEETLKDNLVSEGPLSVSIDASNLQLYGSGIYDDESCTDNVNLMVLLTGFGAEGDKEFWALRNSWGENWGKDGYVRLARNKNNLCGITDYVYFYNVSEP